MFINTRTTDKPGGPYLQRLVQPARQQGTRDSGADGENDDSIAYRESSGHSRPLPAGSVRRRPTARRALPQVKVGLCSLARRAPYARFLPNAALAAPERIIVTDQNPPHQPPSGDGSQEAWRQPNDPWHQPADAGSTPASGSPSTPPPAPVPPWGAPQPGQPNQPDSEETRLAWPGTVPQPGGQQWGGQPSGPQHPGAAPGWGQPGVGQGWGQPGGWQQPDHPPAAAAGPYQGGSAPYPETVGYQGGPDAYQNPPAATRRLRPGSGPVRCSSSCPSPWSPPSCSVS